MKKHSQSATSLTAQQFSMFPIGYMRCSLRTKFDAPHQPAAETGVDGEIELVGGMNFEQALRDLEGFERIWLIWAFHKNRDWKPIVMPPRGVGQRRGVFATRSPHRPNSIGMTVVQLKAIRGRKLLVGPIDLLDGTPILDIKPYIPQIDAFPTSRAGWVDELESDLGRAKHVYEVLLSPKAREQAQWLFDNWKIDFVQRVTDILTLDPRPHRTRRIVKVADGFRIGCGAWRVFFAVSGSQVTLERIEPGYPAASLRSKQPGTIPDHAAQIAFIETWAGRGLSQEYRITE